MYNYDELIPAPKRSHKVRNVIIGIAIFLVLSYCAGTYEAGKNEDTFTVVAMDNYKIKRNAQRKYASSFIRDPKTHDIKGILFTEIE